MKNKTTVLVLGYLPPPYEGTAKLTQVIINSKLLNNAFNIVFLSLKKNSQTQKRGALNLTNLINNFLNYINFIKLLIFKKPKLVYMALAQNKFGFTRDSVFILIANLFHTKVCLHFLGGSFNEFYNSSSNIFKKYIKNILNKSEKIILLANKIEEGFTGIVSDQKFTTVYNCAPDDIVKPQINKTDGKFNVLFLGYLSKAKGALDLVKAAEIILKQTSNIYFYLCGQGVDIEKNIKFIQEPNFGYSKIKEILENPIVAKNVIISNQIMDEEKEKLFNSANVFILPSYSEGMPMAVLEAMQHSLPLITTTVGAMGEVLTENENTSFVDTNSPKAIADKILFLFNNKNEAERIGVNNKKLITDKYNSTVFAQDLSKIWTELTNQS